MKEKLIIGQFIVLQINQDLFLDILHRLICIKINKTNEVLRVVFLNMQTK